MEHYFKKIDKRKEICFNAEFISFLDNKEKDILQWLLAESFEKNKFSEDSFFPKNKILEIGPQMNFATPWSTNAISVCRAIGLKKIKRVEISNRYVLSAKTDYAKIIKNYYDRMTECVYFEPLQIFEIKNISQAIKIIPLIENGIEAFEKINQELGLGMDEWDINFYYNLFVNILKRNPTDIECFQLSQMNSEHSRHWFFKGKLILDGSLMPMSLLQIIQLPLKINPSNSIIAFKDNSSGIRGYNIKTIIPLSSFENSRFEMMNVERDIIFTAETHNFPTSIAPFSGAETGIGGRIRDVQATGKGALPIAGTAGYCVGNLNIPNYNLPWENKNFSYPTNFASPLQIEIEASNGASDYGNKIGEPIILGFTRSFGLICKGERREWIKPIMFTGGIGQIDNQHIKKSKPEKDMVIIQIGGPAYRIGVGGGSASSVTQGENRINLDFNAVQRGDAEMEQKVNRIVRACVEMGDKNPIESIHDQGAGGPCNVITELVDPVGGKIEIRNITLGDETLSALEIWGAEYQERLALLIYPENLSLFQKICQREKVTCEILGKITEDEHIVVTDMKDNSVIVNLSLSEILNNIPQKEFKDEYVDLPLEPLNLPKEIQIKEVLKNVLKLISVGSKGFLVRKVDRSVTGLIAQQQCCGPLHLPVSNVAIIAQSHFDITGAAIAIGEQPIKMLINPKAGARMTVGEMLTNMVWALINDIKDIKCSVNWMWPAKFSGEGVALYESVSALSDIMVELEIAADGGKDSLSMAVKNGREIIKSPNACVVSGYATMPDIRKIITPDIKYAGESKLCLIDLGNGKNRLGGSALAHIYSQIGNESPDVDNSATFKKTFEAVQKLISSDLICAGHDRSDGGLITTLIEMALSGNCGIDIDLYSESDVLSVLFSEELGLVMEYLPEKENQIKQVLKNFDVLFTIIGRTIKKRYIKICHNKKRIINIPNSKIRSWWESTSCQLEKCQMEKKLTDEEKKNTYNCLNPEYHLTFNPQSTSFQLISRRNKPKVAIIREEGSNGDREMASAFYLAGFEPWDVTMTDLLRNNLSLNQFRGISFVGGFSYADVFGSAKGWAASIKFNSGLKEIFKEFYNRPDTFSLGVCNGCQLMTLLGWVPWENINDEKQPRFIRNLSKRFESRWVTVKILPSPAIMFKDMDFSVLGIWVAHGEGRLFFPDLSILKQAQKENLLPMIYVDDKNDSTEKYPFNPNGSISGITALCSPDGRHLAMMPHPERTFLKWQWAWMPHWMKSIESSPWLHMFQNARKWCE